MLHTLGALLLFIDRTLSPCSLIFFTISLAEDLLSSESDLLTCFGVGIPPAGKSTPVILLYSAFKASKTLTASSKLAYS